MGFRNRVHHDTDPNDAGYFTIYDEYQQRNIYICSRAVGKSRPFLDEFNIKNVLDLIGPKDLHPIVMTEAEVRRFYLVMMLLVIEMANTEGNLCVYCYNGRSRSPAFVAAYLVVVECYSCRQAYSTLSRLFVSSRGDERGIDRDRRFIGYVLLLEKEVSKK
jgi:hypothetical protein